MRPDLGRWVSRLSVLFVIAGCTDDYHLEFVVDTTAVGTWSAFELAVIDTSECPTLEEFLDLDPASDSRLYRAGGTAAERSNAADLGVLPDRSLAFAAVVRDENCMVVGWGCEVTRPSTLDGLMVLDVELPDAFIECATACDAGVCNNP